MPKLLLPLRFPVTPVSKEAYGPYPPHSPSNSDANGGPLRRPMVYGQGMPMMGVGMTGMEVGGD
ncbi:hypothetical protein HK101_001207, partial [Irineochytrium annulatum]